MPSSGSGTGTPASSSGARSGMLNLILRLRGMTETTDADYDLGDETYWSDLHLQDILDLYREDISLHELYGVREYSGSESIWKDYPIGAQNLEDASSNAGNVVAWSLVDSAGDEVSSSDYTVDYVTGLIRFDADTSGVVYYLRARTYSLNRAAADVWRRKMAHTASLYNFSTEGQSFQRAAWFEHCREMVAFYEGQGGMSVSSFYRSDLA